MWRTKTALAALVALSLPMAATGEVVEEGEEERFYPDTGQTLSGTLQPEAGAVLTLEEMRQISVDTLNQLDGLHRRLLEKTSRTIPPLPIPDYFAPSETLALPPASWLTAGGVRAPNDFILFKNTNPTAAVPGGFSSTVNEPSVVAVDESVFYTGNWYAADSSDGGDSFTFVNPFSGPFPNPSSGGFCCDQVTAYDPDTGALFWLQQYFGNATTGVQRINVDQEADGVFDCFYDISPQTHGFASGNYPDFPDLAVSDDFLYHSSNVFSTTGGGFAGAFVGRYAKTSLAACSSVPFNTYTDPSFFSFKLTRGANDTMYFADHISNTSMRIWRWPDAAASPTSFDRTVAAWNDSPRVCPGPDGRDFCGFIDRRIAAAYVADGVVGFMWVPSQGSGFSHPYTRVAQFDEPTLLLNAQPLVWSSGFAWIYPAVAVNRHGDLGGTIQAGGGSLYATCLAWLADDANGGTLAPLENFPAYFGTSGPATNRSGDYNSASTYHPNDNLFAGACFGYPSTTAAQARYVLFGREKYASIFTDGFESGDVAAWASTSGAARFSHPSGSVWNGDTGLRIHVGPTCPPPANKTILGPTMRGVYGACNSLTIDGAMALAPGVDLQAPEVALDGVTEVPSGVPMKISHPTGNQAWLHHAIAPATKSFNASFRLNVDNLTLAVGDRVEHFRGGIAAGAMPRFSVFIDNDGSGPVMALEARQNDDSWVSAPAAKIALPSGWMEIDLRWVAGLSGLLEVSINGGPYQGLYGLFNFALSIDSTRWGAVAGATHPSTGGTLEVDLYGAWR